MITNREIASEALLEEALAEVVDSAREHDLEEAVIASVLRAEAERIEAGETAGTAEPGEGEGDEAPGQR